MPRKPTWLSRICTLLSLSLAISPSTKSPPASSSSENSETFLAATAKYPHFQLPSVDLCESLRTSGPPGRGGKPLGRVISRKNEQNGHGDVEKTDKENENQDTADNTQQDYTLDKDTHDISSPSQLDPDPNIDPSFSEHFSEPPFTIASSTFPEDSIITETPPISIARRRIVRLVSVHRKSPSGKKDEVPLMPRSPLSMNPVLRYAEEMEMETTNKTTEDKKINEKEEKKDNNEEQHKQQNQDKKPNIKSTLIELDHLRPPPPPPEIKITVPPRSRRRLTAPPPPRTHPYSPLLSPLSSPFLAPTSPSLSSQSQSQSQSQSPTLTPIRSKCSAITAPKVSPGTPPVPPPPFPFAFPTPTAISIPILIPSQPSTDRLPSLTSASTATTKSSSPSPPPPPPPPPQMLTPDSIREPRMPEEDIYASWADYYFDERNFLHPMRRGRRGKMGTFPVRTIVG